MTGGDIQAALLQALMQGTFSQLADAISDVPAQVRAIVTAAVDEERDALHAAFGLAMEAEGISKYKIDHIDDAVVQATHRRRQP